MCFRRARPGRAAGEGLIPLAVSYRKLKSVKKQRKTRMFKTGYTFQVEMRRRRCFAIGTPSEAAPKVDLSNASFWTLDNFVVNSFRRLEMFIIEDVPDVERPARAAAVAPGTVSFPVLESAQVIRNTEIETVMKACLVSTTLRRPCATGTSASRRSASFVFSQSSKHLET